MTTPHIAVYDIVLSDAIDRAVEYCEDHASDGVSAPDLAYIYQTIRPDSNTGAVTPLRGLDLSTVNIPEAFHPEAA